MTTGDSPPLQRVVLYMRPGCHLCEESSTVVRELLEERAARGMSRAELVERNIETDEVWYRMYSETIPVLEIEGTELPLAVAPSRIRAFLDAELASAPGADRIEA